VWSLDTPERAVHVPYKKMASPERDKPRSLRKDGFAGTDVSPFEKVASPERDKPRSLQKDGFAGTNLPPNRTAKTVTGFNIYGVLST
jgi:hypothetical protein